MSNPTDSRYAPWVRHLHWLVFVLVTCALLLIYIHGWTPRSSPLHASARWAHMQFGMAVLLVMLPRLLIKARSATPAVVPPLPAWQAWLSKTIQLALYVLLIVTPLLGIANRAFGTAPWNLLGIPMPHVAHPDNAFAHMLEGVHGDFGNYLMYLAALHALAALIHHYIQRDNVLRRMLPGARD